MSGDRSVRPSYGRAVASRTVAVGLGLCLAGLFAPGAWARSETVAWSYAMPCQASSFELRWGTSPDALTNVQNVGKPRQSGSQFSYQLEVPDDQDIYACVAALQDVRVSPCSQTLLFSPSDPPDPALDAAPAESEQLYCQDFTGARDRADWVDTGPSGSGPLFSVDRDILETSSPENDVWSHFRGDSQGTGTATPALQWSHYELSGDMTLTDFTGGIGVTLYSGYPDSAAYYRLGRAPGGEFHLERDHLDPSFLCTDPSTHVVPTPGVSYTFRVRARPGADGYTVVDAKVWRSDKREPEGFPAHCVDARPSSPVTGAIGVWSASGGTKLWDDLAVATVPEVPPASDPLGVPGKPELAR